MTSYRLRIEVRDVPGALAELTTALARAGCDVLRVDVQGVDGRVAVDEVSLLAPDDVTASELTAIVTAADAVPLLVAPLPVETDVDPVAAALGTAGRVTAASLPAERVRAAERGLAGLLSAEAAWILPAPAPGEPLLAHEVVDAPTVVTVSTAGGAARDAVASLALVPVGGVLGIALRWGRWSYTASELARGTALLDLLVRTGVEPAPAHPEPATLVATPAGGHVAVRPLGPGDAAHLLDLDLRLSDRTRRLRFNGSRGLPTGRELRHLAACDDGATLAVGAWSERGLVGVARMVRLAEEPSTAELAIVVADADQRRGVGTTLLRRLVAEAGTLGVRRLVARTAPHNGGIRRLLAALSPATITRIAHGEVEVLVDVASVPAHDSSSSSFSRV